MAGRYRKEQSAAELRSDLAREAVPVAELLDTLISPYIDPRMLAALAGVYAEVAETHDSDIHLVLSSALMRVWRLAVAENN